MAFSISNLDIDEKPLDFIHMENASDNVPYKYSFMLFKFDFLIQVSLRYECVRLLYLYLELNV